MSDLPVVNTQPSNGELQYSEGSFIGYRAWRKANRRPLIPFGHGLSYTTFTDELMSADRQIAQVKITNTGSREGAHVVQIYGQSTSADSFERRLIGFAKVFLAPGASTTVDINLEPLAFKKFDGGWQEIPGDWVITLAADALADGESLVV
jgi:beta-glucosidase